MCNEACASFKLGFNNEDWLVPFSGKKFQHDCHRSIPRLISSLGMSSLKRGHLLGMPKKGPFEEISPTHRVYPASSPASASHAELVLSRHSVRI